MTQKPALVALVPALTFALAACGAYTPSSGKSSKSGGSTQETTTTKTVKTTGSRSLSMRIKLPKAHGGAALKDQAASGATTGMAPDAPSGDSRIQFTCDAPVAYATPDANVVTDYYIPAYAQWSTLNIGLSQADGAISSSSQNSFTDTCEGDVMVTINDLNPGNNYVISADLYDPSGAHTYTGSTDRFLVTSGVTEVKLAMSPVQSGGQVIVDVTFDGPTPPPPAPVCGCVYAEGAAASPAQSQKAASPAK